MKDLALKSKNILFELVGLESENQILKWGIQDHEPSEWLMFLTEEIGELAKAIAENQYRNGNVKDIIHEAIQVATLSLKIAEMFNKLKLNMVPPLKDFDNLSLEDNFYDKNGNNICEAKK